MIGGTLGAAEERPGAFAVLYVLVATVATMALLALLVRRDETKNGRDETKEGGTAGARSPGHPL
jgi:hypothetical protein